MNDMRARRGAFRAAPNVTARRAFFPTRFVSPYTTMNKCKKERLIRAGWKFGTVQEILGLSDEENAQIEMQLKVSDRSRRLGRQGP